MPSSAVRSNGPRVLLNVRGFPQTSETFIANLVIGLLDRGWDVRIVAGKSEIHEWRFLPQLNPRHRFQSRLTVGTLDQALIDEIRPDVIHIGFGGMAVQAVERLPDLATPFIVSFRGSDIRFAGIETPGYYDHVWARAALVHLVSEELWERALDRGCPPNLPHAIVPDQIDTGFFTPTTRERPPDVLGTVHRPLNTVSVARLDWTKGHEFALLAMRQALDDGLVVRHRIVGDGKSREEVAYTIWDLGLSRHVKLLGAAPANRVRSELQQADVFLLASVTEGFCNALLEAHAMELPIIATDAGGNPEIVRHGETGIIVPRRDPAAIVDAMRTLAVDAPLRERLARAGSTWVRANIGLDKQLDATEAMYYQAIGVSIPG